MSGIYNVSSTFFFVLFLLPTLSVHPTIAVPLSTASFRSVSFLGVSALYMRLLQAFRRDIFAHLLFLIRTLLFVLRRLPLSDVSDVWSFEPLVLDRSWAAVRQLSPRLGLARFDQFLVFG